MVGMANTILSSTLLFSPLFHSSSKMNLALNISSAVKFNTHSFLTSKTATPLTITAATFRPSPSKKLLARDRVIDFGKYNGKMLGTLPSNYLKWVSKNLRARDFEEWANLADEVLTDPVYRDRIEWEFAEKILSGNAISNSSKGNPTSDAVSELLEISERFGWDNQDKSAWSKIDFGLLGTSKGGRIPRAVAESRGFENGSMAEERVGNFEEDGGRKRDRRERMRQQRVVKSSNGSTSFEAGGTSRMKHNVEGQEQVRGEPGTIPGPSRFPGREGLLKKVLNRQSMF